MESEKNNNLQNALAYINDLRIRFISSQAIQITTLLIIKFFFQMLILYSGYRWLSADDYCRTVKSYEWLQNPVIDSGVWLTPHFWINGFVMLFVKDLFTAALIVNIVFSSLTVLFFYKIVLTRRMPSFQLSYSACFHFRFG